MNEVQHIHQFLVDLVGVVALAQVVGEHAHGVLETQGHAGVQVGFHLRDGDVERLAPDDLAEDLRHHDFAHHPGFGQQVAIGGLFFERH